MNSFYIARHGNTFWPGEVPVRIGSRTDLPLTDAGEHQSAALGDWFTKRGITFSRAFAGSLTRTRRTAELILASQSASLSIETADWLTEIDHCEDEGRPDDVVSARVGADALRVWDEQGIAPSGWHVAADTRLAAWRKIYADRHDGDVLLVTSGGAARFALLACGGARPSSLKLRTGAFGQIVKAPFGKLLVAAWDVRPPQ